MDQATGFNIELHSLLGRQTSEDSIEMSMSSLSLNMTSDESMRDDSLKSSDSPDGIGIESPAFPNSVPPSHIRTSGTEEEKRAMEMEMVINFPDAVIWSLPTKTVNLRKAKNGSVGFHFKEKKGKSYYLIVHTISRGLPAYDKLKQGDRILSVNGHNMDCAKNIREFASIVKNSGAELKFIVQSPKKLIFSKISPAWLLKLREFNDKCSKPNRPLPVNKMTGYDHFLDVNMPSLPFLKLFILGQQSSSLTLSLIGAASESELQSTNDVAACGYVDVKECNNRYDWLKVRHNVNYFSDVIRSRRKFALNEPYENQQSVRLEVVAIKEGPVADSCYQLLLCKHAIYAIQFSIEQLVTDPESVLHYLQKHLCKIRCYASTDVRVYLIGTQDRQLPYNVADIGSVLHDRFSATYGKMLQYDPRTNAPCFVAKLRQNFAVPNNTGNRSAPQRSNLARPGEQVKLYDVQEISQHISKVAIGQGFIETSYPHRYLQLHKQVHVLRGRGLKCVLQSSFSLNHHDAHSSLTYLHDSGDIINAGNLEFPTSMTTSNPSLIMIDRYHLLMAACAISNAVPEWQCRPNDYHAWQQLKASASAEKSFLTRLTGECHQVDFLEAMNVIHCLQRRDIYDGMNNVSEETYLVPVYLPACPLNMDIYDKRQLHQQLCVDFNGLIPDGLFWRSAMLIVQRLKDADWIIQHRNSIRVHMPRQCEFIMERDALKAIININTIWTESYSPLNLLHFMKGIFSTFTMGASSRKLKVLIGPPCPLSCDECQQRRGIVWKTHIVDVSLYSQHNCLFCGTERIDDDDHVSPWIQKEPQVTISQVPDDTVKCLSLKTPVPELPAKVTQIICDYMNVPDSLHHNWQGLANLLNYTTRKSRVLENHLNPTAILIEDYGRRRDATFGGLLQLFKHEELMRNDVIKDIEDNFEIVE